MWYVPTEHFIIRRGDDVIHAAEIVLLVLRCALVPSVLTKSIWLLAREALVSVSMGLILMELAKLNKFSVMLINTKQLMEVVLRVHLIVTSVRMEADSVLSAKMGMTYCLENVY